MNVFEKIREKIEWQVYMIRDTYGLGDDCTEDYIGAFEEIINQVEQEYNNGWIACSERLPDDCDNRFYMCIVENHEEDLPMFCQYDEDYGFGFWHDIYDEHTLGFVDSEFRTNEELGYEKVIAWQPLPPAYTESSSEIPNE